MEKDDNVKKPTLPIGVGVSYKGTLNEEYAQKLADNAYQLIKLLSAHIDISNICEIKVADDYNSALREIDRGIPIDTPLEATDSHVVGIAMSASILRNNELKSVMVFYSGVFAAFIDGDEEQKAQTINIVAHEMAHVESNYYFDKCFPDYTLRHKFINLHQRLRISAAMACWDEFFACWITATIGRTDSSTFVEALEYELRDSEDYIFGAIDAYHSNGDIAALLNRVGEKLYSIFKFCGYFIGDLMGLDKDVTYPTNDEQAKWFHPIFEELCKCLRKLSESYGNWDDFDDFLALAELYDRCLGHFGLYVDNPESENKAYLRVK